MFGTDVSYETKIAYFLFGWKPFLKAEKLQAVKLKQKLKKQR